MVLSSYGNKYRKNVLLGIQTYTARLKSNFSELDSFFKWEMLMKVFRGLVKISVKKINILIIFFIFYKNNIKFF